MLDSGHDSLKYDVKMPKKSVIVHLKIYGENNKAVRIKIRKFKFVSIYLARHNAYRYVIA